MLSPSGDAKTIAFAESNSSGGPWGLIDVPTGAIVRNDFRNNTGWFNYEIGTDRFGDQFLVPTYGGAFVHDAEYRRTRTLGTYAGPQPIGVAFHPVEGRVLLPWSTTSRVREYETSTWTVVAEHEMGFVFGHNGNHAFQSGRARLSRDGSLLMVSVDQGVQLKRLYAPLTALPAAIRVISGRIGAVRPTATVGNGGRVEFAIAAPPAAGIAGSNGTGVQYRSNPGFVGADVFRYRAMYGRAIRDAEVRVDVVANGVPVARNDSAKARHDTITLPVLANDGDPDGDPLRIVAVSTPAAGSVEIDGNVLRFHPPALPYRAVRFTYTVADIDGATATANVTVLRR
jgi:hypothetical protein